MEILFLYQHFELENDFDSDRSFYTCKKLVEAGHKVTVITGNLHYKTSKQRYPTKSLKPIEREYEGIKIYYIYSPENIQKSYFRRVINYIFFYWFSKRLRKKIKRANLVYAISPPLTTVRLGLYMSKRLKAKFIMEVSDAWPDVLIEMGFLKNPLLKYLLRKLALKCYNEASTIIALTRGIQKNIQNKIPEKKEKVFLVTNGVNPDLFTLDNEAKLEIEELKNKFNPENKFVCFYFGAHSLNNALFTIIETARLLKSEPEILFILLGGGDKKDQLQQMAKEYGLENILFLPPVPRNKSPLWLQLADIFLLPYLKGKFFRLNLPNKFFDYLASGKPIILAGEGETADVISKSGSGKIVKAEDFKAMANAILQFKSMPPNERIKMGENGRKYVFEHFSRSKITERLIHILSQLETE